MFEYFAYAGMIMLAVSLLIGIVVMTRHNDPLTRAVVSDLGFYSMIGFYLIWSTINATQIAYDVVLLAALAGGVLPTLSMARIISRGRR